MKSINKLSFIVVSFLLFSQCIHKQEPSAFLSTCTSPDSTASIVFMIKNGLPFYEVKYEGEIIIAQSALGLDLEENPFGRMEVINTTESISRDNWRPVIGESEEINNHYNQLIIELQEKEEPKRRINIGLRAFDEGVAFRYEIPKQDILEGAVVKQEKTSFTFAEDFPAYAISTIEGEYVENPEPISSIDSAYIPLTVELGNNKYASLFEAFVAEQPPTILKGSSDKTVQADFREGKVILKTPTELTWRGVILASSPKELIENRTIVENLNPPLAIDNPSWITPGKHLNMRVARGVTTEKVKEHINIAKDFGLNTVHIDWSWYGTEKKWSEAAITDFEEYMPEKTRNDFEGWDWKANTTGNPTTVAKGYVPYLQFRRDFYHYYSFIDFDPEEMVEYGKEQGVNLSLYVNGGTLKPYGDHEVDKVFRILSSWGVKNIKPGFVPCSSQEDIAWLRNLIAAAAKYKLTLCIHDEYIADGIRRTYPNVLTQEGGRGRENKPTVSHELLLPFTRHLVGPHDHTPTIYSGQSERSKLYEVAQLLVYHGGLQSIRFLAENRDKIGVEKEFITKIPTTWDEEKILLAAPGDYILIARRSGDRWFLGGMNDETERDFEITLDFLEEGKSYNATIFYEQEGRNNTQKQTVILENKSSISISFPSKGGYAAIIE